MIRIGIEDNKVIVPKNGKKDFNPNTKINNSGKKKSIDFACEMAYGEGHHNPNSFGSGNYKRNKDQIFRDALQGKIAEVGFYNYFYILEQKKQNYGLKIDQEPEFEVWGKGEWEDCDFTLNNGKYNISIKSTKYIGNLLLLERDRYTRAGLYREPEEGSDPVQYDAFFLCRVSNVFGPEIEKIRSYKNLDEIKCEVTGFITYDDFIKVIKNNQFIQKGTILGTPMKVDNYYVCAQDLKIDIGLLRQR